MKIQEDTLEKFGKYTNFDIKTFLQDFIDFSDNHRNLIISYYKGDTDEIPQEAFNILDKLIEEANDVIEIMNLSKNNFESFSDWNLLEELEDIRTRLYTTLYFSKYLRSSVTKSSYNEDSEVNVTLKQNETLEKLANELGYIEPQDNWGIIALRNNLKEEDYTTKGDLVLDVSYKNNVNYFKVNSVVDNMQGNDILGKDIDFNFSFKNDDINILAPKETFKQTIKELAKLKKGDNPFYPKDGLDVSLVVGSNLGGIAFPSLFRQLNNNFNSDDTIASFTINDINLEQNALIFDYKVESKLGNVENDRLNI